MARSEKKVTMRNHDGRRLAFRMIREGASAGDVAKACGVREQSASRWFRIHDSVSGRRPIYIEAACVVLGVKYCVVLDAASGPVSHDMRAARPLRAGELWFWRDLDHLRAWSDAVGLKVDEDRVRDIVGSADELAPRSMHPLDDDPALTVSDEPAAPEPAAPSLFELAEQVARWPNPEDAAEVLYDFVMAARQVLLERDRAVDMLRDGGSR